jgi:molybdopterin-guanine dinucleotide biosynthesis protein A
VKISGVIQAGGHSVRMGGRPKALIELGGRPIIARVLAALAPAVDEMLLVTNTPELYTFLALPMVGDLYADHGSLGGIYSGLKAVSGTAALVVACDMPFLHPDVVKLVASRAGQGDVVIPRVGTRLETMHAAYGKACLPHIAERLVARKLKIVDFLARVRVVEIAEADIARFRDPRIAFMNVNTPDDLERARALAAELG